MNSLNIITARVSPPSSPVQSRSNSIASIELESDEKGSGLAEDTPDGRRDLGLYSGNGGAYSESARYADEKSESPGENTPLLHEKEGNRRGSWWHSLPRSFASSIVSSIRWIFATLTSPGVYLIACFYDEQGIFAPMTQLKRLFGVRKGGMDPYEAPEAHGGRRSSASNSPSNGRTYRTLAPRPTSSSGSSTSGASSESELDDSKGGAKSKHARSKSLNPAEELNTARRSIRIKLHNDEALKQRKHRRTQSAVARTKASEEDLSAQLKSPTSPIAALTKYPKTPAPPRPLIPRRQPSYLNIETPIKQQKTLILDLDETLIHSMSKGGRMSTGHMVEVRLNTASLGMGARAPARRSTRSCTGSTSGRTATRVRGPGDRLARVGAQVLLGAVLPAALHVPTGAYIKDLSSVEPDLSKVMILDNSPLSYLFHEDNAIPIQGWINDPTDNDLMHLVPLLEGLQYVHDVRALLALRGGEEGQHTA
ncbi:hypothetical protein ACCO45_000268 [Purpureocillium lilacinum]|uniref:Uncharacterized protein n=1 Tax=Purpureocillium lilacinum TaxID=33203 RepID=A0ACC4E556_PURLI